MTRHIGIGVVSLVAACVLAGCETSPALRSGAAQGAQMTVELRQDLGAVVRAQDQLHEQRLQAAVSSINDLHSEKQRLRLTQEARAFAKQNASADAARMADKIPGFVDTSMKSWTSRHEEYTKLLKRAREAHDKNRQTVELDESQLGALHARFVSLSNSRSRDESIKFMVEFAKSVQKEVKAQKAAQEKASNARK